MSSGFDLGGKVAIVTGAASGQGLATVRALVEAGAQVMAADIDEAGLFALAEELPGVATRRCDVSKATDVKALVDAAEEHFGAVHTMLNCAGYLRTASVVDTTDEMLDRIVDINLKGVF